MIKNKKLSGILAIAAASVMFGLGYALGDVIITEGMSETCNGLWTAMFGIAGNMIIGLVKKKNPFKRITPKQTALCIISGGCAVWLSNLMFLVAYRYMEVAEVTMLHFLYPSMIAVFMTAVFKEQFTGEKLGAIVSSIIGMLIITGGFHTAHPVGLAAAISTGALYAVYPIMMEKTSLKEVGGNTVVMYMNLISGLSALSLSLATGKFMLPVNTTVLLCQIGIAVGNMSGYLLTAYGVRMIGATNASFGSMLEPVASCAFAAVILGQSIGRNVLIGSVFIILSVLLTSLNDAKMEKQKARQ